MKKSILLLVALVFVSLFFSLTQVGAVGNEPIPIEGVAGFAPNIGVIITGVLQLIIAIAGILVLLYLIWGAIGWITAGGDSSKVESARNKITQGVIGLIVLASSYAILIFVLKFLGFESLSQAINSVKPIGKPPAAP